MKHLIRALAMTAILAVPPAIAHADDGMPTGLGPLHQIVWTAAADHGISYWTLDCITVAESTYDPYAVSPTSDYGLEQFHRPWDAGSLWQQTPYAAYSPYNAWASANAAAYLIARGYGPRWSTWHLCAGA